jgi:hypothetical protein
VRDAGDPRLSGWKGIDTPSLLYLTQVVSSLCGRVRYRIIDMNDQIHLCLACQLAVMPSAVVLAWHALGLAAEPVTARW